MGDSMETHEKIEETVLKILGSCDLDNTSEFKVRKIASEELGLNLLEPERKKLVRKVVESYLAEQQAKAEVAEEEAHKVQEDDEEPEEEEEEQKKRKPEGAKEYDADGDLIICRLTDKRRVTITDFKGKTLVSIREYYKKDGKELPTAKGISLTAEQWASFKKNVPAIEKAIKKIDSRLN